MLIPNVIEKSNNGERVFDLESRLLEDRIVVIGSDVNDAMAKIVVEELMFLNNKDSESPIHLYIMSPGGSVNAGLGIIDMMNIIDAPVYTYAFGYAASMGAALLSSGEKGHRYVMPNSQVMVHQVSSGNQGTTHDIIVDSNYTKRLNNLLLGMIAKNCGVLTEEEYDEIYNAISSMDDNDEETCLKISKATKKKLQEFKEKVDRDVWLMPNAAIKFGIADSIIRKRSVETF